MGLFDDDFTECPNCGSTDEGDSIYECPNCGFKGCYSGGTPGLFGLDGGGCYTSSDCPSCGGTETGDRIGRIVSSEEDSEESSEDDD